MTTHGRLPHQAMLLQPAARQQKLLRRSSKWLTSYTPLHPQSKVLDIDAGTGAVTLAIASQCKSTSTLATDYSSAMLDNSTANLSKHLNFVRHHADPRHKDD